MSLTSPLFSVIIPTYNRPADLIVILNTLFLQKNNEWEVVIVDDSSASQINEINELGDDRIKYHHRKQRLGVSSARNDGTKYARGRYLVFLDDDDRVSENWLDEFASLITENEFPDVLFCGYERVDPHTKEKEEVLPSDELWKLIFPGSFIIKADFFNSLGGYDEQILYGENTELFIRIRATNYKYAFTDSINFFYYQSIDGGSKNLLNTIESNKLILNKHKTLFQRNLKAKKFYLRVIGVSLMRLGRFREARFYLVKSYLLSLFEIKGLLRIVISFFPFLAKKVYTIKLR